MIRLRDAAGNLKAVAAIRVRTAAGLVAATYLRIRDGEGLKAGLAPVAGPSISASISPPNYGSSSLSSASNASDFTVSVSGGVPTAYVWTTSIVSGDGDSSIISGQGTATARIVVSDNDLSDSFPAQALVTCTVTVNGQQFSATATKTHNYRQKFA